MLNKPDDFVGIILAKMITKVLSKPQLARKVKGWKMSITLSSDYYPVTIIFDKGISVIREFDSKPTLNVKMKFETIINMVEGKSSMIGEMFRRRISVEGLVRHPIATYRFYKFMQSLLEG